MLRTLQKRFKKTEATPKSEKFHNCGRCIGLPIWAVARERNVLVRCRRKEFIEETANNSAEITDKMNMPNT